MCGEVLVVCFCWAALAIRWRRRRLRTIIVTVVVISRCKRCVILRTSIRARPPARKLLRYTPNSERAWDEWTWTSDTRRAHQRRTAEYRDAPSPRTTIPLLPTLRLQRLDDVNNTLARTHTHTHTLPIHQHTRTQPSWPRDARRLMMR